MTQQTYVHPPAEAGGGLLVVDTTPGRGCPQRLSSELRVEIKTRLNRRKSWEFAIKKLPTGTLNAFYIGADSTVASGRDVADLEGVRLSLEKIPNVAVFRTRRSTYREQL